MSKHVRLAPVRAAAAAGKVARRLCLAVLCVVSLADAGGASPGILDGNAPAEGTLGAAGETADFTLGVGEGDYVEGALDSGRARFDLELVDRDGTPTRLLLDRSTGRDVFRFVYEKAAPALRVTARAPGAFTLSLIRTVRPSEQKPPPRAYLSDAVAAVARALKTGESTDAFWQRVALKGTPLIEQRDDGNVVMTFLVRGARNNVRLLGGPSSDHERLERLGDSDIWFKSFVVPASTRLSYRIAPDIPEFPGTDHERRRAILAQTQVDPFNKHPWPVDAPDRYNQKSRITLPAAPPQPGVDEDGAPKGTLTTSRFESTHLGYGLDVTIYTPVGFDPDDPETIVLVLFDGEEYQTEIPTPTILDNLIDGRRLPPVVAVFLPNRDNGERSRLLPANPVFATMLAEELMPWVARQTAVTLRPDRTVLAGSSFGGLAAATVALRYPQQFGVVLSLSGSFWWHPDLVPPERQEYVADLVVKEGRLPVRFFLSAGTFEADRSISAGILETSRHLRDVLEAKGYSVTYREYAAGHDYFAWQGALSDGLLALFGRNGLQPAK